MKYFTYHDYPVLPEFIKQEILEIVDSNPVVCEVLLPQIKENIDWSKNLGLPLSEVDKHTSNFLVYDVSENISNWISKNIPEKYKQININSIVNGTHLVPHIDEKRTRAVNYVIETGGSNVITSFYKVKKKYQHLEATTRTYIPRHKLTTIEKITIKKESWHSLAVQNIHDVRNIKIGKRRIILTLSID